MNDCDMSQNQSQTCKRSKSDLNRSASRRFFCCLLQKKKLKSATGTSMKSGFGGGGGGARAAELELDSFPLPF